MTRLPRTYYLFGSGRLERRDNTLYLVPPSNGAEAPAADRDPHRRHRLRQAAELVRTTEGRRVVRRRPIPVEDVEQIYVFGELDLNSRLLNFLGQHRIPLHLFNFYGYYSGTFYPREQNVSGFVTVRQVEHYLDAQRRLYLAKEWVAGAVHHIRRNLLAYRRQRGIEVDGVLARIDEAAEEARRAGTIRALMAAEGRCREAYYEAFNTILVGEVRLDRRVRRPPDSLVNALISFGNSLMYTAVLREIYLTQLDPTVSFLHEPSSRRFSLALDLAEIFKPLVVDRMLFTLLNRREITAADAVDEHGLVYLTEQGRKKVVAAFDQRLEQTVRHRRLARHVSYRTLIRLEGYKLVKHLVAQEPYQALRAWW